MTINKESLKEKILHLIDAYRENITADIMNREEWHTKYADCRVIGNIPLFLSHQNRMCREDVLNIVLPGTKKDKNITLEYVENAISRFCILILQNANAVFDSEFESFYKYLTQPTTNKYIVGQPITINLQIDGITKLIDLDLTNDPEGYLKSKHENYGTLLSDNFDNPDLYTREPSTVGAFADIEAIDNHDAKQKFDTACFEVIGFMALFYTGYHLYMGKQKTGTDFFVIYSGEFGGPSWHKTDKINRVHIDDVKYQKLLDYGLSWLNSWREHSDKKKAEKIKNALYWFKYANDEINITNKFIYAITILETLLKDGTEQEISTTIAERVAYLLSAVKEERINIFTEIKSIYTLRSKIIHEGLILNKAHEHLVLKTIEYVRIVLINSISILSYISTSYDQFIEDLKFKKF